MLSPLYTTALRHFATSLTEAGLVPAEQIDAAAVRLAEAFCDALCECRDRRGVDAGEHDEGCPYAEAVGLMEGAEA